MGRELDADGGVQLEAVGRALRRATVSSPDVRRDVEGLSPCHSAAGPHSRHLHRRRPACDGRTREQGVGGPTHGDAAVQGHGAGRRRHGGRRPLAILESLKRIESQMGELALLAPQAGDAWLWTAFVGYVLTKVHELVTAWESAPSAVEAAESVEAVTASASRAPGTSSPRLPDALRPGPRGRCQSQSGQRLSRNARRRLAAKFSRRFWSAARCLFERRSRPSHGLQSHGTHWSASAPADATSHGVASHGMAQPASQGMQSSASQKPRWSRAMDGARAAAVA
jgi:hypothetical protein